MPHKRYNVIDDAFAQLQTGISASTETINIVLPAGFSWVEDFPTDNTILTLVQYWADGNPVKKEKVYLTNKTGNVLTVQRGYLGTAPQSFSKDDYIFLNVVAEHIDDIHMRIDEVESALQTQVTDIYANGDHRLRVYRETGDPALQVRIWAWAYRVWWAHGVYAGGTLTLPNDSTTYISLDVDWVIQTGIDWDDEQARVAKVITASWSVTNIELWKPDLVGGKLWGTWGGFENITSTTYTQWLLTSLIADGVTYTLTYEKRKLKSIYNGANTWTATYSWNKISTTSKI